MKSAIILILTLLLTACATNALPPGATGLSDTRQKPADPAAATPPHSAGQQEAADESEPDPSDEEESSEESEKEQNLPPVTLTSDLMYEILAADFAYQSGQWEPAFDSMMSIAARTRDPRAARRAAEMAIKAQHVEKSLSATRLWYQLTPDSLEAERYYLAFLVLGGELTEAQPLLARRLGEAPASARGTTILQLQRLLAAANDRRHALSVMEDILQPYASMYESRVALSLLAFTSGNRARAVEEANRALAIKPDSELAVLALAQAIANPAEASSRLADFLKTFPNSRQVRISYARILIEQKKYEQARAEFEKLLASKPDDPLSLYSLGILSLQGKDAKRAEKYLTDYLDAASFQQREEREMHQVLFLLAQIAEEQGDADAALKWLARIESEPGNNRAYLRARIKSAQIMAKKGDLAGARKELGSVHVETPAEQEQVILAEAQLLREAGLFKDSYDILASGVEQLSDKVNLLYDFALAAEKLGKIDVMENALRRILVLDPANYHAYNALGYSLADRNLRLDEARALIEKALKLAPEDPFIMDSMGWVLYRQGKLAEAENMLRQSYRQRPDVEIAIHLGEVLWVSGQQDEARKIWAEAARKEPNNEMLKSTLQRLKALP